MKYTSLKQDIINILSSTDANLNLKMYDKDGNTTINADDANWVYIFDKNIMIEMMTEDTPVLYFWKGTETLDDTLKSMLQRIREIAILNGVSVQIRVYNNLNQRKIYNLIKTTITTKREQEDEEMTESINPDKELVEAFTKIISSAKSSSKASDFYLSEEMKSQNVSKVLSEMFNEVSTLPSINSSSKELSQLVDKMMTATSRNDVEKVFENVSETLKTKLFESLCDINNVSKFVKQRYENNLELGSKTQNVLILENVKVYKVKVKNNHENLSKAYNKLLEVSDGIVDNLNLLKVIKQNKICETFGVTKRQLIDYYICGNNKPVKEQFAFVIENVDGDKIAFSTKLESGIKALANYFNNGGSKDSQICKNIVSETVKYNNISDFILEYKDNYSARRFIPRFKKIFKECVARLNEANVNFSNALFEGVEENYSYENKLKEIQEETGLEHPALKYLAIVEAKKDYLKSKMLYEQEENDMKTLVDELRHFSNISSVVAASIIHKGLGIKNSLTESVDKNNLTNVATIMYNELCKRDDKISSTVSSSLFNIIHTNKKLVESKVDYIKSLIKYSK